MNFIVQHHVWLCCSRTAEQGLVASVCGGQGAQALEPLVQNSAQMARVTEAADGHTVKVHRLHKVAQQCPLQAEDVPSEEEVETEEVREKVEWWVQT